MDLGAPISDTQPVSAPPPPTADLQNDTSRPLPVPTVADPSTPIPVPATQPEPNHRIQEPAAPVKALAEATDGGNPDMTPVRREVDIVPPPAYSATPDSERPGAGTATASNGIDHKPVVPLTHPASDSKDTQVLPTAPAVHPEAQADALKDEDPEVVGREVEKTKGDRRELEGKEPGGTIIQGLEDDKLWTLLRRFDLQVTHTLTMTSTTTPPHEPDLRRSTLPAIPFNSDVLKSNVERCYATIGIVSIRFYREICRLRSWAPADRSRTIYFCSAYFAAWVLGYAIPLVLVFLMVLVVIPDSRHFFFPAEIPPDGTPPSVTDPSNRKGDESLLGDVDKSVAHRSKAEQAEEQAWEFTQLAQGFLVKVAMGGRSKRVEGNATVGEKDLDADKASTASEASEDEDNQETGTTQGQTGKTQIVKTEHGHEEEKPMSEKQRKKQEAKDAKAKRDQIVNKTTKGVQDALGDIADIFECMANALSPPPPYPRNYARFKIAFLILMPVMFATALVPAWIWLRGASLAFGFGFFGQPVIDRGLQLFVEKVPDWQVKLDIRNSILSGVPTNDQLVLHLLRARHPLPRPPPPPLAGTPKAEIADHAPDPDAELVDQNGESIDVEDLSTKDQVVHKSKSKIVAGFKKLSKRAAGIGGDVTVDGVKKKIGSHVDRVIWGANLKDDHSPEAYPAKLDGTAGKIIITPAVYEGSNPLISFRSQTGKIVFERPINDIVEIKRSSVSIPRAALGFLSGADVESQTMMIRMKTAAEHAASEIAKHRDDVEAEEGDSFKFKTVYRREQLFVRLISMGNQRWESL